MTNKKDSKIDPKVLDKLVEESEKLGADDLFDWGEVNCDISSIDIENIHCDCCIEGSESRFGDVREFYKSEVLHTTTKPKNNTVRYNTGKPKLSFNLIGRRGFENLAKVWEYGETKYDRGNWQKGYIWTEVADCLLRHMVKFLNKEDNDEESGLAHVDHIFANAQILAEMFHSRKDLDDR